MSWSLSQITVFETCGFKYALQYMAREVAPLLGLKSVPVRPPPSGSAQRGIEMHKVIERHLTQKLPLTPDLERWSNAFTEIQTYPFLAEHKVAVDRNWNHVGYNHPDAWVRSILDLKVLKPNRLSVYDWKSGKEWPEHWDQKTLYGAMALAEHPEYTEVTVTHVYMDNGRQTSRTYHQDQLHAFRAQWYDRATKLERAKDELIYARTANDVEIAFPMQPNRFCRWCDFSKEKGGPCRF